MNYSHPSNSSDNGLSPFRPLLPVAPSYSHRQYPLPVAPAAAHGLSSFQSPLPPGSFTSYEPLAPQQQAPTLVPAPYPTLATAPRTLAQTPYAPIARPGVASPPIAAPPPVRRRRDTASIACNICRAKKTACDRARPSCTLCIDRGSKCVYRTTYRTTDVSDQTELVQDLQKKLAGQDALLQTLAQLPPDAAVNVLRQLRGESSFDALKSLTGSMHSQMRPSAYRAFRGTAPPARTNVALELSAQHPFAYGRRDPVPAGRIKGLLEPGMDGGYLSQSLPTASSAYMSPNSLTSPQQSTLTADPETSSPTPTSVETETPYFIDDRLQYLDISYWTTVPISNELAASVLSYYLRHDHTLFYMFDADLFLDNLIGHEHDYCCTLLVHALLLVGCQAYTAVDRSVAPLASLFLKEAEILWRGRSSSTSISPTPGTLTLIAACEILAMGCYFFGRDTLAHESLTEGRRLAKESRLFGAPEEQVRMLSATMKNNDSRWIRMAGHVAWGTYSWLSAHCFYYNAEAIAYAPIIPPPGTLSAHYEDIFASFGVSIDWSEYTGKHFAGLCKFWAITQEVAVVYLAPDRPQRLPLAFAEEKYQKLLVWADQQETEYQGDKDSLSWLMLQCWLHCTVIHIFRPFIDGENMTSLRLGSFTSNDSAPSTAFDASVQQLKHIVFVYLQNVPRIPLSGFFNAAFVHVGHAMVQDFRKLRERRTHSLMANSDNNDSSTSDDPISLQHETPEMTRLYFFLCMRAWAELYVCFPTIVEFCQAFLSMAIEAEIVSGPEAQSNLARLRFRGRHHSIKREVMSVEDIKGVTSLVQLDLSRSNPDEASVASLALKFETLAAAT